MAEQRTDATRLRIDTSRPALGANKPQIWAVATLDDGSEVRMRNCGDRVEVRSWDQTETCSPPAVSVDRVGPHVIDVRVRAQADERSTFEQVTHNEHTLWEAIKNTTQRTLDATYGPDPRHAQLAHAVADEVAFGKDAVTSKTPHKHTGKPAVEKVGR